ncbi:MAG: sugar phosphate isomerase/epimerase [Planctomycetes bacterium]|nr:sugar phosphate isomerase/epimerase [Planctomycetota bacterium]
MDGLELEAAGELLPQNLTATGRREITHLLRSHDLAVTALTCPIRRGLDQPQDLEPRLEQIRLTMALAHDLGPRLVIIQAGQIPDFLPSPSERGAGGEGAMPEIITGIKLAPEDVRAALMKESLDALGKHGDRIGVIVALDTGVDAPETVAAYLDRFDTGSLAVSYNPANLVISGHNPHDAVRTLRHRIVHVHAEDARRISPNRMATVPLGHGDLDWLTLLADLDEIAYRGFSTIKADDGANLAAGVAFLRRVMGGSTPNQK